MSVTVHLDENESVRLTDEVVETRPPDRIAFAVEGTITMTEDLLGSFAGATLNPVRIDVSGDGSPAVAIDLAAESSLRLETVDVGVETPDADDLSPGLDSLSPGGDDDSETTGSRPGAIAFTVEGAILDVPAETFESLPGAPRTVETLTFAVEGPVRTDGGRDDVLLDFTLLGYGVVVYRNGVVEIGTGGTLTDVGLP
ncbi:hypothetical protein [Halopelagius longus]|nr:hypothetical protein [Halopelagius longus]RDI70219.1 hypothetical protein DWB78_15795 [Halopelagius longus]